MSNSYLPYFLYSITPSFWILHIHKYTYRNVLFFTVYKWVSPKYSRSAVSDYASKKSNFFGDGRSLHFGGISFLILSISSWRFNFPSHVISLQPKELPLAFSVMQIYWKQISLVFFYLKMTLFFLCYWRVLSLGIEFWGDIFILSTL